MNKRELRKVEGVDIMKRLLALILSLILCLGFVVSCGVHEDESSNNNPPLLIEETEAEYYYYECCTVNTTEAPQIKIANSREQLNEILQGFGNENGVNEERWKDYRFEKYYVLVVLNKPNRNQRIKRMGYRNVEESEEGYTIVVDKYFIWDDSYINSKGFAGFTYASTPEVIEPSGVITKCDIVVIPKSEFDAPPTAENIQLHNVIYNFTN